MWRAFVNKVMKTKLPFNEIRKFLGYLRKYFIPQMMWSVEFAYDMHVYVLRL